MRHAETVTFGGSGLDRAAAIRTDNDRLNAAKVHPDAQTIILWRGKVLIRQVSPAHVIKLPMDHPVLTGFETKLIFLGVEENSPKFAHDISAWEPESLDLELLGSFLDPTEQRHPAFSSSEVFVELRRVMTWLTPRDAELAATAKAVFGWHESHKFCSKCGDKNIVTHAGWQSTCPSCKAHHFPRTDPVVIMLITHCNSVLVGRSPGWPEGMFSLLAGFVEPGETLEAAVRREVLEEVGVVVGAVEYLASQPWPFPASLMFGCKGRAISHEIIIDPTEIEDAMWITREEMITVVSGQHSKIQPARKGAIAHFLIQNWLSDTLN